MKAKVTAAARSMVRLAVVCAIMYAGLQVAVAWGVERKTFLERFWDVLAGGSVGLLAAIGIFLAVGTVGWVAGPIFGAIGLLEFAVAGAFGGLGLGAVAHIIRDPSAYHFTWYGIAIPLLAASCLSWAASRELHGARWGSPPADRSCA